MLDLINQAESCLLGFTYSGQLLHPDVEKAVFQIQNTAQTLLDKKRPVKELLCGCLSVLPAEGRCEVNGDECHQGSVFPSERDRCVSA